MLYERYTTGDDIALSVRDTAWASQTFTIGNSGENLKHQINQVKLKIYRIGSPGTITIAIYGTSGGKPAGGSLCTDDFDGDAVGTTTDNWETYTFTSPATLLQDTKYAIVLAAPNGDPDNALAWRADSTSPTYTGGSYVYSGSSGSNWVSYTGHDCMFEEYGSFAYLSLSEIASLTGIAENFYPFLRLSEIIHSIDAFISVSNKPVYYYEPLTTSQFKIDGSDVLEFSGIEQDDSLLRNDVIIIGDGVSASTSDSTSIATYGRYGYRYENNEITDSADAVVLASQILENYKDPKMTGRIKIAGKTGLNTRSQFTLHLPDMGIIDQKYEIVQYNHIIDSQGFNTIIYFGEIPWDLTREVANLLRKVY